MSFTHSYIEPSQVNAFIYCPRRFYYQNVMKIFYTNDDVEIGKYEHENHWQNTKKRKELYLISHTWKIKGKIDFIKEENGLQIPIEIKKRRCNSEKPFENDVMQLMCYIVLLEEKFDKCPYGYLLYKGSKRKYKIINVYYLQKKLKTYISKLNYYNSTKILPQRIENKNRCHRCSLREYCFI